MNFLPRNQWLDFGLSLAILFLFFGGAAPFVFAGLLIHEYGHLWMMRRRGYEANGIHAMALGMYVLWPTPPARRSDSVMVTLAGPVAGLLATIPLFMLFVLLRDVNPTLARLCIYGMQLNILLQLFNLLPIPGFDGGHLWRDVVRSLFNDRTIVTFLLIAAGVLGIYLSFQLMHPMFLILIVFMAYQALIAELDGWTNPLPLTYGQSAISCLAYAGTFFGGIMLLAKGIGAALSALT